MPPNPRRHFFEGDHMGNVFHIQDYMKDPVSFWSGIHAETLVSKNIEIGGNTFIYVSDPHIIAQILDSKCEAFEKEFGYKRTRKLVDSLMFSGDISWPISSEYRAWGRNTIENVQDNLHTGLTTGDFYNHIKKMVLSYYLSTISKVQLDTDATNALRIIDRAVDTIDEIIMEFPANKNFTSDLAAEQTADIDAFRHLFKIEGDENYSARSMTTILAGLEQLSTIVFWLIYYVSNRPEYVTSRRDKTSMRNFLNEVIRLHPPIWAIMRNAKYDIEIEGIQFSPGTTIVTSPYCMGRDDRFFRNPEVFDPQRWENQIEKFAFFPFSHGRRVCKGERYVREYCYKVIEDLINGNKEVAFEKTSFSDITSVSRKIKEKVAVSIS